MSDETHAPPAVPLNGSAAVPPTFPPAAEPAAAEPGPAAPEPASGPPAAEPASEPVADAEPEPAHLARDVSLSLRALEDVDMRLSAMQAELALVAGLLLLVAAAVALGYRNKP